MTYVLIGENNAVEKFPFFEGELKSRHKNVSFPREIPELTLNEFGVYKVTPSPKPQYDPFTQKVKTSVECVNGIWFEMHVVENLPEDVVVFKVKERVRSELNETLDDVMYYLERNAALPDKWVAFRTYMREIESQEGYPYNLDWPTRPSR